MGTFNFGKLQELYKELLFTFQIPHLLTFYHICFIFSFSLHTHTNTHVQTHTQYFFFLLNHLRVSFRHDNPEYIFSKNKDIHLHNYSTIIKIWNLTLITFYPLIYRLYALPTVPIMLFIEKIKIISFFLVQDAIQTHKLHLVLKANLVSLNWNSFSGFVLSLIYFFFLFFILNIFEVYKPVIFKMSLNFGFICVFLFFLNFGFIYLFICLFIYDCVGSSFLCEGFF